MDEPTITFRLPEAMRDWVLKKAKSDDRSISSLIRQGILRLMSDKDVREMERKSK
jgi:Arc/MetJ-type ribon-helix-helix transcriptional regulator